MAKKVSRRAGKMSTMRMYILNQLRKGEIKNPRIETHSDRRYLATRYGWFRIPDSWSVTR